MSQRFPSKRLIVGMVPLAPLCAAALWSASGVGIIVALVALCVSVGVVLRQVLVSGHTVDELSHMDEVNRSLGVVEFTTDGIILHANQKFLQLMGYELDELVGQHHSILVDDELRASSEYEQFWESLKRGDFQVSKYRRLTKDGDVRWVNASYNPVSRGFGQPYKVVKLVTDVTREQALAKDNSMIRHALDCSTSNVMIADTDFDITYLNASARELFGGMEEDLRTELPNFRAAEIINSKIDIFHKDPTHQQHMLAALSKTHSTDINIGGHTIRIVASPVFDGNRKRLGTVVDWTDRTQEVLTEREVEGVVANASVGQLKERIVLDGKSGSMLRLSEGVNQLLDVAQSVIHDTMRVFAAMAKGDLSKTIEGEYQGDFEQLKTDANKTVSVLVDVVQRITSAVEPVRSGALEISQSNMNLSERTENQAASLEKTAASMEQITSTVKRNADSASEADNMASTTRTEAQQGGEVVRNAVRAMSEINESSNKIADIVGVIDEIAFQTNLLALNAAVEAARAGEQGRGFAVVANEVRNLAGRSASSAKEIKDLIEDSGRKVQEGSRMVDESGEVLGRIVQRVHSVTDIVAEIATASREQSIGIDEVNAAIIRMDHVTQQNAAMVEQAAAASSRMDEQANVLQQLVEFFSIDGEASNSGASFSGSERRSGRRPWSDRSQNNRSEPPGEERSRTA
ncbi:MAG: methyl-accepting chemotaxis protein [Gammaproteobacteria bacterium]